MKVFRRRIEISSRSTIEEGEVRAALEDDFHHFRALVRHRHGCVTAVGGSSPRHPFTACPAAAGQLEALVGMPLTAVANSVIRHVDASLQCTHLLDLAGLAIATMASGLSRRSYEIEVPRNELGVTAAHLVRDDGYHLDWLLDGQMIVAPEPFSGLSLREGFARQILSKLPTEEAEAALVLRRCAVIGAGRLKNIDLEPHAKPTGRCYSQQPERAPLAIRIVGSTQDFTDSPIALCREDTCWLAFGADA
ncbi:DUF2889 domain-containing protein [Zoogloea sp. LCSB751]|uniref:DUF2889 domain-containing protein n=1 Tax=Zoogloea sp. LCSB751 TaxID=1965277 RepID=UPI0009A4A5EE|nr:DUF2889 domain-containing protein [Zoogloea sp. LCSB751]